MHYWFMYGFLLYLGLIAMALMEMLLILQAEITGNLWWKTISNKLEIPMIATFIGGIAWSIWGTVIRLNPAG